MLASIARCAASNLCPNDNELIEAVRARDDAAVYAISAQFAEDDPSSITLVHHERILKVSDVLCGDKLPGDLPTITCKFTVRYYSRNSYQVARLEKRTEGWVIADALMVTRDRR
jgi:hypothetical protein